MFSNRYNMTFDILSSDSYDYKGSICVINSEQTHKTDNVSTSLRDNEQ